MEIDPNEIIVSNIFSRLCQKDLLIGNNEIPTSSMEWTTIQNNLHFRISKPKNQGLSIRTYLELKIFGPPFSTPASSGNYSHPFKQYRTQAFSFWFLSSVCWWKKWCWIMCSCKRCFLVFLAWLISSCLKLDIFILNSHQNNSKCFRPFRFMEASLTVCHGLC